MFGSNFLANFGIPEIPDPTAPAAGTMAQPGMMDPAAAPPQQPGQPPAAGLPAAPQMPGAPVDSTQGTAPAAGLNSPFGKPQL